MVWYWADSKAAWKESELADSTESLWAVTKAGRWADLWDSSAGTTAGTRAKQMAGHWGVLRAVQKAGLLDANWVARKAFYLAGHLAGPWGVSLVEPTE